MQILPEVTLVAHVRRVLGTDLDAGCTSEFGLAIVNSGFRYIIKYTNGIGKATFDLRNTRRLNHRSLSASQTSIKLCEEPLLHTLCSVRLVVSPSGCFRLPLDWLRWSIRLMSTRPSSVLADTQPVAHPSTGFATHSRRPLTPTTSNSSFRLIVPSFGDFTDEETRTTTPP